MDKKEIKLEFDQSCSLTIYAGTGGSDSLVELSESEAADEGEAPVQLKEGCNYEYKFHNDDLQFAETHGVVSRSKSNPQSGIISPNIWVGTLELEVCRPSTNEIVDKVRFEVRSVKASYREDYRFMVESITEKCTDLLMQVNAPISQSFVPDFGKDPQTDYQRFSFVNSIIASESFREAMNRILSAPTTRWSSETEEKDLRSIRRIDRSAIKQFTSGTSRLEIPATHPLRSLGLSSVPSKIISTRKVDTVDTPENRFIKHALETFITFCTRFEASVATGSRAQREALSTIETLEQFLQHSVFADVSPPTSLRINNPTLQRKAGYREILRVWLMFDLAAQLVWKGGEDVYSAGKRDVATLYEYWLFFMLLDLVTEIFQVESKNLKDLMAETKDGFGLVLKQGSHTAVNGIYDSGKRNLEVRLNYNRTFSGSSVYPDGGSWTKSMRPDYTLSFWPQGISEKEADGEELITHVHFDAKYKIENFVQMMNKNSGSDQWDLDKEDNEQRHGKYKNADLLKMHAYRDAIRRTSGAYVLYPGEQTIDKKGFREILPGLGAFPVRPSRSNNGIVELKKFIKELVSHLVNRASQRERVSYRLWEIHRNRLPKYEEVQKPEPISYLRDIDPDETYVLIGLQRDDSHREWIENRNLYNIRRGDRDGAIEITEKEIAAGYLLLYDLGETVTGKIKRIFGPRPRVYNASMMGLTGYEVRDSSHEYTVFAVTNDVEDDFKDLVWDLSKIQGFNTNNPYGKPFVITLSQLMQIKVTD